MIQYILHMMIAAIILSILVFEVMQDVYHQPYKVGLGLAEGICHVWMSKELPSML